MKIRNGFVSNSSSSSFVAIGYVFNESRIPDVLKNFTKEHIDKCTEEEYGGPEKDNVYKLIAVTRNLKNINILVGSDNGMKDDKFMIGKILADHIGDGEYDQGEIEIKYDEIVAMLSDVQKEFDITADMKPSIIVSTRSC